MLYSPDRVLNHNRVPLNRGNNLLPPLHCSLSVFLPLSLSLSSPPPGPPLLPPQQSELCRISCSQILDSGFQGKTGESGPCMEQVQYMTTCTCTHTCHPRPPQPLEARPTLWEPLERERGK